MTNRHATFYFLRLTAMCLSWARRRVTEKITRSPKEIATEMAKLDKSNAALLADILKGLG